MSKFTIEFEMGNYKKSYEKLYDKDIKEILNSIKYYKKGSDEYFIIVFGDKNNFIQSTLCRENESEFLYEQWSSGEKILNTVFSTLNDVIRKTNEVLRTHEKGRVKINNKKKDNLNNNIELDDYIEKKSKNNVLSVLDLMYNPYNDKNAFTKLDDYTRIEIENQLKNPYNKKIDCEIDLYKSFKNDEKNVYNLILDINSFNGIVYIFKKSFKRRKLKGNELLTGNWKNHHVPDWSTIIYSTANPNIYNLECFSNDKKHMHKSILYLDFSKKEFTLNMVEAKCGCHKVKDEKGHWYEKDNYQYMTCKSLRVQKKIDELIFMEEYFDQIKCKVGKNTYNFDSKFKENKEIEEEQIGIMVVSNQKKNAEKSYCEIKSAKLEIICFDQINEINDIIVPVTNIKNRFSGMNDEPYGEDLLDYKSYAKILGNIIVKNTINPPVTFGIYSSWGNGKSFLLNQIEIEIKTKINEDNDIKCCNKLKKIKEKNYLFIKFNAWEYSGSDILWAGLIKCLYDNVEDEFGTTFVRLYFVLSDIKLFDILFFIFKLLFLGIGFIFYYYFKDIVGSLISLATGILVTSFALFPNLKNIYQTMFNGHFDMLKSQIGTIEQKIGFMAIVKKKLEKLNSLLSYTKCQAIIFIDDLDRCTNEKAVDILNAVKLLLAENNFYTFIAVDPRLIINAIENKYSKNKVPLVNGYEFMDKIIQIPFTIPKMSNKNKNNFISKLLNELVRYNIANYEIDLIFSDVTKIKYDEIPEGALNFINRYNVKDEKFFRLTYKNRNHYFYLDVHKANPIGKIFISNEINVFTSTSKIYYNKKDKILWTKILNEEVVFLENYKIKKIDDYEESEDEVEDVFNVEDNSENSVVEKNNSFEENNLENKNSNEINDLNEIIIDDNIKKNVEESSEEIIFIDSDTELNIKDNDELKEKFIIDKKESMLFTEYSRYFDSNGRRMKRIINMYMVSREFLNKKVGLYMNSFNKFDKEKLLISNILFAEQWPYCLSMIIVYLEYLLLSQKEIKDFKKLKIINILNILRDKLFLNKKWKKLSYNDSRIDKLELFLEHLDEKYIDCYTLFIMQKNFIFNLNPSIKSYILKDMNELKLDEINIININS